MKHYPSIPRFSDCPQDYLGRPCIAFEKPDGSNIRAEWSKKQGWYKFGTRKTMIGGDSMFKQAADLVCATGDTIPTLLGHPKFPFVAFFEFLGDGSFAGFHVEDDKRIVLLDVSIYKRGMITPDEFTSVFPNRMIAGNKSVFTTPKVVFKGVLTQEFVDNVRSGKIGSFEGAVIKGTDDKGRPWMAKVKSEAWLDMVRRKGLPED